MTDPARTAPEQSARGIAWRVLVRVERDAAYADLALHAELRASGLDRRDRALATELCYGTLRLRGRLDAYLEQVLDRKLSRVDIEVRNLLRLGAYQILCLSGVRPAAAVSEAAELAKATGHAPAARLVNAVLRRLAERARELRLPSLDEDPIGWLTSEGSLPEWLAERWLDELGAEEAAALARVSALPPPRSVRVSQGVDLARVAARLRGRPCRYAPRGVTECGVDPVSDQGFERGEFSVQDEASQLVPLILGVEPGDTVVDCCAAPGGKTLQLAELVGPRGEVIALDSHVARLALIGRGAARLGLHNVRSLERDVSKGFDLRGRQHFRRILVDAPCSGLGTLRRNPDARWRLSAEDVERVAEKQLAILSSAARYVEPEGALVYSVCSMAPEETSGVTSLFLDLFPGFRVDDARPYLPEPAHELLGEDGALWTLPHRHGCDGFYAVRLVPEAAA